VEKYRSNKVGGNIKVLTSSFNPCFIGIGFQTFTISSSSFTPSMFQSLFYWNPLLETDRSLAVTGQLTEFQSLFFRIYNPAPFN